MKKILISLAAMMIWSSCVIEDAKDEDPEPSQNPAEENKDHDNNDGKTVIEPYVPDTNFASEAERKAAKLVDNSIKETIDILREYQYPKTYTLTVPKYDKAPAREGLSDLEKSVYDSLYHCALRYEIFYYDGSELDKGKNPLTDKFFTSDFMTAYDALRNDFPELTQYFGMDFENSTRSVIYTEWIMPGKHGMDPTDKETIQECREVFDAAISRIMKAMPQNLCDFDKYRYIAVFIDTHNTYDRSLKTVGAYWPCYNVIINKSSVCSGYAETFLYLCRKAGLWCEMHEGTQEGVDHAWNRIIINGKTYLCDCTFADTYTPNSYNWMKNFVQGADERSFTGEYLDMDGKPFLTSGESGLALWE